MTGSTHFLLEKSDNFKRSFKKLVKSYKSKSQQQEFINFISDYLERLIINPYLPQSRNEPVPSGCKFSEDWQFYKLVVTFGKGASGQIRLMYLVNETEKIIKPLWIYNHQQFEKRPPDKDIGKVMKEIFEE